MARLMRKTRSAIEKGKKSVKNKEENVQEGVPHIKEIER